MVCAKSDAVDNRVKYSKVSRFIALAFKIWDPGIRHYRPWIGCNEMGDRIVAGCSFGASLETPRPETDNRVLNGLNGLS